MKILKACSHFGIAKKSIDASPSEAEGVFVFFIGALLLFSLSCHHNLISILLVVQT